MPFLSRRALDGLKNYKYHSAGYTILDVWHTPFWNWLTLQLPMYVFERLHEACGATMPLISGGSLPTSSPLPASYGSSYLILSTCGISRTI